jgi:hypothetical protein
MNNSKKLALICVVLDLLLFTKESFSQAVIIPNIFSPGTPARSAEVNANFSALANAINKLPTQTSNAQTSNGQTGVACQLGKNNLALTYVPTNNVPNTFIGGQIDGRKLTSVPVIDLIDGAHYSITFPAEGVRSSWGTVTWYANIDVIRSKDSMALSCGSNITINGYSAYLTSNDSYTFTNTNDDPNGATGKANASITIFFGGSQATVSFFVAKNYTGTQTYNSNTATYTPIYAWKDMDYVINFPWAKVTPLPSTLTNQLQAFVNSISFKSVK